METGQVQAADAVLSRSVRGAASALLLQTGDVRGIVARAISMARAAGRDYMVQGQLAAAAVAAVRPDLSATEVLEAVRQLRELSAE